MPNIKSIRDKITKSFVSSMQEDHMPWRQPWGTAEIGMPMNFASRRPYSGINALLLLGECRESPMWGSKSAWAKMGLKPFHGEKPKTIVGIGMIPDRHGSGKIRTDANGKQLWFSIAKQWKIFNYMQMSGEISKFEIIENNDPDYDPAEQLIKSTQATVRNGGKRASYNKKSDFIRMPSKRSFETMSDYYETIFHELCHWSQDRFDPLEESTYAFNELVAEIGACFLMAHLKVPLADEMIEKSNSYLAHWLEQMNDDSKFIFDASARASKVADYLLSFREEANHVAA